MRFEYDKDMFLENIFILFYNIQKIRNMDGRKMIIGFEKMQVKNQMMNVEISDRIPSGYVFLQQFAQYDIYEKQDKDNECTNHYFIAVKRQV